MADKDDIVDVDDPDALTEEELATLQAYEKDQDPTTGEGDGSDGTKDDTSDSSADGGGEEGEGGAGVQGDAAGDTGPEDGTGGGEHAEGADGDGDAAGEAEGGDVSTVPIHALHKERAKHKETREERDALSQRQAELEEKWARVDERLKMMSEGAEKKTEEVDPLAELGPAPDPEEDIFAYAKWQSAKTDILESKLADQTAATQKINDQTAAKDEESGVFNRYHADIRALAANDIDEAREWAAAYQHLRATRLAQYGALGHDQAAAIRAVDNEELGLVRRAEEIKTRPTKMVYDMAVAMGYTKAEAAAADAAADAEAGAAAGDKATNGAADKAAEGASQIDKMLATDEASTSLSDVGGGTGVELTADAIASMSDAEFDEWAAANPKKMKRLMGA